MAVMDWTVQFQKDVTLVRINRYRFPPETIRPWLESPEQSGRWYIREGFWLKDGTYYLSPEEEFYTVYFSSEHAARKARKKFET